MVNVNAMWCDTDSESDESCGGNANVGTRDTEFRGTRVRGTNKSEREGVNETKIAEIEGNGRPRGDERAYLRMYRADIRNFGDAEAAAGGTSAGDLNAQLRRQTCDLPTERVSVGPTEAPRSSRKLTQNVRTDVSVHLSRTTPKNLSDAQPDYGRNRELKGPGTPGKETKWRSW